MKVLGKEEWWRSMTYWLPLALFQIIPPEEVELYHAMDNVDLQWPQPCPRSCPASPSIHCHTSTFPPLPLATSRGEAVHVVSDSEGSFSTLPHRCQGILPRIAINVLLFDHFYEPTKYCSKCIAYTNSGILWLIFLFRSSCSEASSSGAKL